MPQRYSNGATKAPDTPGSKRATRACDYPESLSLAEVNALFTESQEPRDAESSTQSSNRHHSDRTFIDVEEQGPVPDFLGHAMPITNSFNGDHFSRGGARDSFMRSWVNQVLISDVHGLNLHEKQTHVIYSTRGSSEAYRAWFNPTLWLEGQATRADLFDIGYAEYYQDFTRSHSFTLNSLGYRGRPRRDVKFRWMHLESISSNFRMLENLVTECPFISNSLRSVALKVLLEASQQCSNPDASRSQIDTGTVIRYVGRRRVHSACTHTDTQDTQPVIFASTPHLLMAQKPTAAPVSVEPRKRNLIEFLYGSESGSFQQPWSGESTANGFKHSVSDMLEVPEASFLLIGSDILISISRMPWQHMVSSDIAISRENEVNARGLYTIQIIDQTGTRRSDLVIEKECSHESFVRQAFGLPRNDRLSLGSYVLVDEHERLVNHSVWHDYLRSGEVERHAFQLKKSPSLFQAEHTKNSSTGSAEFNETSTDVSSHQATALEPSHTRIYKSELSRPNEFSFSISNHEAKVWPSFTQQPVDTPDKVDQDSSKSCLDSEPDSIAVYYMGMPFMIRSYRSYDNASSVSPQYLEETETTQRFPDVSTSTHERINLSKHDNIRTLLAKQRVLGSPLKGPPHWFLSHCEGQDTNSGLVGDGSVLSHKLMDKIQQAILKSPFELLLTKTIAYTRDSVYDRCQILCSITDKEMSPLAIELDDNGLYEIYRPSAISNIQSIFRLSEDLFSLFLPLSNTAAHTVSERYWGALDSIIRQIYLSTILPRISGPKCNYVISSLLPFVRQGELDMMLNHLPSSQCNECNNGTVYSSIKDAVYHLHERHITCYQNKRITSILDDPCSSWVCLKHWEPEPEPYPYDPDHHFYGDLLKIRDKAQDVHASVTGEEAQVEVSLIHCFEYIICKFLLAAEEASLINQSRLRNFETGTQNSADKEVLAVRVKIKEINQKIYEQLDLATRDIMMSGTTRGDKDQLIVCDIGQTLDIIQYYRRVSSSLQYIAVRDPRRRRFLEISALEEETEALHAVIEIQMRMVKAFKKILNPDFFRHETTDDEYLRNRSRRHILEREHLERHLQKLSENIRSLETLLGIAQVTKYKMKQVLEVLDEGHGKAIRVFTFVTLFFLPLSFVTSFFGMNTTDVRDIGWDQRLFWSSAVPLTVTVMSLALIYGYKWDTVLEFRDRVFKSHEPCQLHSIMDQDSTTLTEESNAETSIPISSSASPKRSRLWGSGVERLRFRRWRKREADARQTINESRV
ncbi:uncharacterized protein FFB20_03858 [Fusarium fujikuroi]|nr:uncharacterized protein FFB20_03858 [Fusarium fujikuroi]SCO15399.1 uncharacterized protein FFC1_12466 [Fusarium fujikuroi]SCO50820.1 uncharacterized protein FFNC_13396 [Fusarium fujikuroi]SCO57125.1 uncharacterized protein FFMR_14281 [Fusarium fujikuroi]